MFRQKTSCGKDGPVVAPPEPEIISPSQEIVPPSVSAMVRGLLMGYHGDSLEVPVAFTGSGPMSVSVLPEGVAQASFKFGEGTSSGVVRIVLPSEPDTKGSVKLVLSSGALSSELSFETKTYRFAVTAEPVELRCYEGAAAPWALSVDTDIPDCSKSLDDLPRNFAGEPKRHTWQPECKVFHNTPF